MIYCWGVCKDDNVSALEERFDAEPDVLSARRRLVSSVVTNAVTKLATADESTYPSRHGICNSRLACARHRSDPFTVCDTSRVTSLLRARPAVKSLFSLYRRINSRNCKYEEALVNCLLTAALAEVEMESQ
ncbi:hypothetical protein EVAR_69824_1 [Eumeta japonica]|uniref:Uncharacterized protein n=1 Tax=Eumeta variegata TaxID=151549 RepID=A0A4C2A4G6_EUMVA|nr:hypothetical protein EVAR_69824_1 [Eumeta japonica]